MKNLTIWACIFVLGFILGCFLKFCNTKPNEIVVNSKKDTVTVVKYVKGDSVKSTIIRTEFKNVVSVKELNAYIDSIRFYEEKYKIDSSSYAIVKDSVYGKKTWSEFKYFGQPYTKLVNTTIHDSILVTETKNVFRNGLYVNGEVGGNQTSFNYSVGASFISKKKWSVGYRYGLNHKTHNLSLGFKLL